MHTIFVQSGEMLGWVDWSRGRWRSQHRWLVTCAVGCSQPRGPTAANCYRKSDQLGYIPVRDAPEDGQAMRVFACGLVHNVTRPVRMVCFRDF